MAVTLEQPPETVLQVAEPPSQTEQGQAPARRARLDYLDALKVALIALVIAHHVGQAYGPTGGLWPVSNPEQAPILGTFFTVNASFFMGLFFLISALFVPASFDRKGSATFLKDRFVRLGVPVAVFVLIIAGLLGSGMLGAFSPQNFLASVTQIAYGDLHLAHLWFVNMLLVFVVLYAAWRLATVRWSIGPLPVPGHPAILGYVIALALVTFIVRIEYPIDRWVSVLGIMPAEIAHLPQYASLFVIGLLAYRGDWLREMPTRTGMLWLAIGLGCSLVDTLHPFGQPGGLSLAQLLRSTLEAFLSVGLCLGLVVLFRQYVAAPSRLVRGAAPNTYGAYLIQLFIIVPLQMALLHVSAPALIKFALVALLSIPVCFVLAEGLRRLPGLRKVL
jgi:fucose 4-O-acetylase-like acetyltransferase